MSDINGSKPTNFPLDESKLDFKIPRTDAPRENVLKLGSMITNRIGLKATADDPEYWGLAGVMTDEMVDVALKMGVRKPKTTEQLMKLTKMERKPLEKLLTEMAWTGIIEYNWENLDGKNPKHEKRWVLPLFVPGSAEFLNMRKSQIDEHPEVAAFFERMTMLPLEKITPMVPPGGAGIGMHVIPVEKAIETENESVDLEHISYWLSKYEGKYAKSMCSCRLSRAKLGEGCGDDAESWCIGVGDMADYIVETQRGEYITKDEALEIFKKAEDNGFVHQITNIDGEQKIFGICNCNVNVCNALRTLQLFNTPNLSRSAYVASVESESCVACGRCVENCPAGAVKLGQKLCTKDGYIEYPRQELPDDVKWGPEKWSVDYRDRNRINCYDTGTSPCKTACPAHIAVQSYLKLAAQGKYREALQLIKRENPFPAVCGRICNRRCEDACTRGTVDQAVAIDEVKRFIAQQDLNAETRFVPEKVIPKVDGEFSEKIAVIGGEREYSDTGRLRYAGVLRALTERGITFDADRYYKTAHYSFDEGYTAMAELLRETSEITAVFAMADVMAIGAARAVRDAGKRIPEDISLIGFDGLPICRYYEPRLSTVTQQIAFMAEKSYAVLLDMIENGSGVQHVLAPYTLEKTDSIRKN